MSLAAAPCLSLYHRALSFDMLVQEPSLVYQPSLI